MVSSKKLFAILKWYVELLNIDSETLEHQLSCPNSPGSQKGSGNFADMGKEIHLVACNRYKSVARNISPSDLPRYIERGQTRNMLSAIIGACGSYNSIKGAFFFHHNPCLLQLFSLHSQNENGNGRNKSVRKILLYILELNSLC